MIIEEIKNIKTATSDLRKFGITMGVVLGILGGLLLWRGKGYYFYFFILSLTFLVLGLVLPRWLKIVYKIWMSLTVIIGWVMTRVILTVLFYFVVTPISLLMRLFGRNLLDIRFESSAPSYWIPRKIPKFDKTNYEKQF